MRVWEGGGLLLLSATVLRAPRRVRALVRVCRPRTGRLSDGDGRGGSQCPEALQGHALLTQIAFDRVGLCGPPELLHITILEILDSDVRITRIC